MTVYIAYKAREGINHSVYTNVSRIHVSDDKVKLTVNKTTFDPETMKSYNKFEVSISRGLIYEVSIE